MPTTVHHSYGERVGNSLKGILIGLILIIGSIIFLCINENAYVEENESLEELRQITEEANGDSIDASLEGNAIHFQAVTASTDSALTDDMFGIIVDDLKLRRKVSMYQWEEDPKDDSTDNVGGSQDVTTTHTHHKVWSENHLDSSSFKDEEDCPNNNCENPSTWEYESQEREKSPITAGAYTLTDSFVRQLNHYTTLSLKDQNVITPSKYQGAVKEVTTNTTTTTDYSDLFDDDIVSAQPTTTNTTTTVSNNGFYIQDSMIYIGKNPSSPEIGDMKIVFSSVHTGKVSIIGKQVGTEVTAYKTSNGRSQALFSDGSKSLDEMIDDAKDANSMKTWLFRFLLLFVMYLGFSSLFNFIETIAKVLPFLGNLVGAATGVVAFALTLVVGFATIAIAWLAVRPVIGICCLVVVAGGIYLLLKAKKQNKNENQVSENQ